MSKTAALTIALKRDTKKRRMNKALTRPIYKIPACIQLPSFSCRYSKTHRGFGGGLGVRWVPAEQWAAEAEALPGSLLLTCCLVVGLSSGLF